MADTFTRRRPNSAECAALVELEAASNSISATFETMQPHLKDAPQLRKELKMAATLAHKSAMAAVQCFTPESAERIKRNARDTEIVVRYKRITQDDDWQYVKTTDMCLLIATVLNEKCAMCIPTAKDAESCPICKMLLTYAITTSQSSVCPFMGAEFGEVKKGARASE